MNHKKISILIILTTLLSLSGCRTATNQLNQSPNGTASSSSMSTEPIESFISNSEEVIASDSETDLTSELQKYTEQDYSNAFDKRKDTYQYINGEEEGKLILLDEFDDTTLYMSKDSWNMIVADGDEKYIFDIICTSVHGSLPSYLYRDIDQDGEKEIAIANLVGTGTGVCVYCLYLLDRNAEGKYEMKEFTTDECVRQMENYFSFDYNDKTDEVQYYVDGEAVGKLY